MGKPCYSAIDANRMGFSRLGRVVDERVFKSRVGSRSGHQKLATPGSGCSERFVVSVDANMMGIRKSRSNRARMVRLRSKLRLLLTDSELEKLDRAVVASGALSRSLVVAEAMREGLSRSEHNMTQERRGNRIDLWVPRRLIENVRQLANTCNLTQQNLLRRFLLQYLATAPWNSTDTNPTPAPEDVGPEVLAE